VVGPFSQQLFIAATSAVQIPDFADGCPFVSHWKLEAGCFDRQSVAAVTAALHQVTSTLLNSQSSAHAVVVLGHAVVSVAQRVVQSALGFPLLDEDDDAEPVDVEVDVELVVELDAPVPAPRVEADEQAASVHAAQVSTRATALLQARDPC
jgi:hypothetical protein